MEKAGLFLSRFGIHIGVLVVFMAPLLCLLLLTGFGNMAYAQGTNEELRATGLIVMTPEEAELFRRTHREVGAVVPNAIALERINAVRAKKGLPLLPPGLAAPPGREFRSKGKGNGGGTGGTYGDSLPVALDNSEMKCFPPIGNQLSLGSCTTFATTYYQLTHTVGLVRHKDDPSWDQKSPGYPHYDMIYSPRWTYNFQRNSENTGSPFWGNYDVLQYNGACTWATFEYDGKDCSSWCTEPEAWREAIYQRIEPISYITDDQIGLIKETLNAGYVVTFATYISSWQYTRIMDNRDATEDDPYIRKYVAHWVGGQVGGHAMTIVGYNDAIWADVNGNRKIDTGELGAFRIANSWGENWRENGFTWLAYDALKAESDISGAPSPEDGRVPAFIERHVYVMELKQNGPGGIYTPKLLAEFTLNHAKRNQLLVNLGISGTDPQGQTQSWSWYPGVLNMGSGEYECNQTFVLDFTDLLLPEGKDGEYHLGIFDSKEGDPATLSSFLIMDKDGVELASSSVSSLEIDNELKSVSIAYSLTNSGVTNYPPQAVISATPATSGLSPLTVEFNGEGSSDLEGSALKYLWFFGDTGSHPMVAGGDSASMEHTYNDPGRYAARLSVTEYNTSTGSYGVTTSAVQIIDVSFGTLPEMFVENNAVSVTGEKKGRNYIATAQVKIVTDLGFPISGATVTGDWSGATTEPDVSAVTNTSGIATITSRAERNPQAPFIFTVSGVVKEGWTYNLPTPPPSGSYDPSAAAPERAFADSLQPAYPSPANPETWIPFSLSGAEHVVITIYDASGRLVRKLDLGPKAAGAYLDKSRAAYWDGRNEAGEQVSSGIYFYTIQAGEFTATKKMVITR